MNDAMHDSMSNGGFSISSGEDTLRASTLSAPTDESREAKGTFRGWKEYLWGGGTSKRSSRANSINTTGGSNGTVAKQPARGVADRRLPLQDDLFTPPDESAGRSSSRASSIYSNTSTTRKQSASLASMALQLVAGKANAVREPSTARGRSSSAGQSGTLRASSAASVKTSGSSRTAPVQGGPKALMAMRRATPASNSPMARAQAQDRWETMSTSPPGPDAARPNDSGPVEMDTMYAPDTQPPSLTYIYNNYPGSEFLTDRFGFIYDQRRKKRQREAAQVALQMKSGSRAAEMLSGGRPGISPNLLEDGADSIADAEDAIQTPSSAEEALESGKPKRWQDYLKIATFPTELLSHTPLTTASNLEVLAGHETPDPPKSPGLVNDDRGFLPVASTTAALDSEATVQQAGDVLPVLIVQDDNEPVKLLLKQLSDVHDVLQKERSVRWNEFLRKVRAERRKEGEAAAAAAAATAEARFQKARVNIPEAKYADGEIIGVADLGVKGKVGQNKWNEFRKLVLAGIPVANRPKIWAECSGALFKKIPGYYEDIVAKSGEDDDPAVVSQIEMDINRTLTDNIFFRKGPGVAKLNEVLRAYARRNPEVGYCQGMNLIAANLLLIMPSAEETFWILVSIIEKILPRGYYDHSLMASRADQQVLRQYVALVLPKLSEHLDDLSIELEALTFQWFLSVFTDCLSAEALFRVWDVVLCTNDGSTFLFQVALALLKLNEPQLLLCDTPSAIYTYINHQMTNHAISIDGLINASEGLRKVIRREDVEARRTRAIEAEQQLMREREEANRSRRSNNNNSHKAMSAPALVTETSASAVPSPCPSPSPAMISRNSSSMALSVGGSADENPDDRDDAEIAELVRNRATTPLEEETVFSLG
ncbi:rab-GTPase-TBC domain-domain-containing protein [Microdochium bolleyi]|uniref:Rab-GTPase-TBC domain-domain-containing protein n=1 Tax=Microdochium bolleyi TaxID=196109 RepID=A0A136JHV1_9PEZI|nr:rab-GTPase-TBC domain-domain-containing protein [Microdochium bolleyi]